MYKYIFKSKYLVITWWAKEASSWEITFKHGMCSLGRIFIEWYAGYPLI
jgi:hypothetical protein